MMKALAITARAESQPISTTEVARPQCAPDEILVRNQFVGVNKGDAIRRKRALFPADANPPFILGFEGAGEVVAVGSDVQSFSVRDTVGYLVPRGAFAEFIALKASLAFRKPESVAAETLAASCCIGLTAIGLLDSVDDALGKTILVHGGTGSVGSTLLQIGQVTGLRMFATVSTASDMDALSKPSGGFYSLDHGDFADGVLTQTGGQGVEVIFDCLGQAVLSGNMKVIRPHGTIFYYGSASGHASFPGAEVLMRSLRIQGFVVFDCAADAEKWERMKRQFSANLADKVILPEVRVIEPSQLTAVMDAIDARQLRGRVVVDMRNL